MKFHEWLLEACAFIWAHSSPRRFSKEKPVPLTPLLQIQLTFIFRPGRAISVWSAWQIPDYGVWACGLKGWLLMEEGIFVYEGCCACFPELFDPPRFIAWLRRAEFYSVALQPSGSSGSRCAGSFLVWVLQLPTLVLSGCCFSFRVSFLNNELWVRGTDNCSVVDFEAIKF